MDRWGREKERESFEERKKGENERVRETIRIVERE
jgi:hypothetical protein